MVDRYNLISITIKNFRGLSDVVIDFTEDGKPKEIMTFFGHQGSGKSTIILAIQWCAYGTDLSKKQKLGTDNLFPDIWDNVHKDTMSVTLRFRDSNNPGITNKDIVCKRMLIPGRDRDEIEVFVGEKKSDKFESREYFNQIFGSMPSIRDGVMWVVRTEEMAKMSQTIASTKSSESYFLNFMNLDVPHDGLKELSETKRKAIKKLMPKGAGVNKAHLDHLETQIRIVDDKIKRSEEKYDTMALKLLEFRPTATDEEVAAAGEGYKEAKRELENAETRYDGEKIKKLEVEDLITTLLVAKLEAKGVNVEKSFDSAKFEWGEIADYLELTNSFPAQVIRQIREIQEGVGYDTTRLINSSKNITSWLGRIKRLKDARINFNRRKAVIDDYHHRNINEETTSAAIDKSEKAKSIRENMRTELENINEFSTELKGLEEERDSVSGEIVKTAKNKEQLLLLRKEKKVIDALINIINESNRDYESKMFEDMISSVKSYWERIDQIGTYRPILVQEPKPQIALERISDNRVRYIELGDETGKASGGEDQLLLVCTCLAVSATSGAKMPIILDDCFTVVDTDSRKALVNTVAKDFKNMIFVTNDTNNAKLFTSSQGILNLKWPTVLGTSINNKNISDWHTWIKQVDLND